ncbi:MAG: YIP1 family protein [Anaerolineae bacterium]
MLESIGRRLQRLLRLDWEVFREIRTDEAATREAALIVGVSALLSAVGVAIAADRPLVAFLLRLAIGVAVNWLFWSYAAVFIGTNFYGSSTSFWEMARSLGYANVPMLLVALNGVGCIGWLVTAVAWLAAIALAVFAVRETLEIGMENAIITTAIAWVLVFVVGSLPSWLLAFTG